MLRKIIYTLFTTALAYGTIVNNYNNYTVEYISRISEEEFINAQRAPVYTKCINPGQVAFTFDDGPYPDTTPKVLKFLKEKNIVGTFFITAYNTEKDFRDEYNLINNPESIETVKEIVREGHYIGSHTFYHEDLFDVLDKGRMEMNIDMMTDKIQEIIGAKPIFFRPPLGNGGYYFDDEDPEKAPKNEIVQKYLGASGFKIIMWGADTRDWENLENVDGDINELNKKMDPSKASPENDSFIILMHDIYETTADLALPRVYEYVTGLGYEIVPLTECLGMTTAYQDGIEPTVNELNIFKPEIEEYNLKVDNETSFNSRSSLADSEMASSFISHDKIKMVYSIFVTIILSLLYLH